MNCDKTSVAYWKAEYEKLHKENQALSKSLRVAMDQNAKLVKVKFILKDFLTDSLDMLDNLEKVER